MVLGARLNRHVLSEIWTAAAQVDCDVQHRPDELALGTRVLQVESAQYAVGRPRQVVLYKRTRNPGFKVRADWKVSTKKPLASPKILGSMISTSGMAVSTIFINKM
jgi:hypothetical protein